jgi:hypothetical protein
MDSRKILKKLLAALEIEQAIPEINQEEKAPVNDEIQNPPEPECIPMKEALPKLFPWVKDAQKCNSFFLLGPLHLWPCLYIKCERPFPQLYPDRVDCKVSGAGNLTWDRFFNDNFRKGIEARVCSYIKSMVKSGCLMPNPERKNWLPLRFSRPIWGEDPTLLGPNGAEGRFTDIIFESEGGDNECVVCLKIMMGILDQLLRRIGDLIGGVEQQNQINTFMESLWVAIDVCVQEAIQEGGAIA